MGVWKNGENPFGKMAFIHLEIWLNDFLRIGRQNIIPL